MDETQWSPTELWKEFDPAHDDLDCQILERREDEDCVVTELTYFSHECEGEPIWVYGILGIPKSDETVPGVLHIHGGGQTANEAHVRRMIEEGYAALTFDWTGPTDDREKVTDFGMASTDKYRIEPGPEYSHLYHATAIARRGLTLLAGQPATTEPPQQHGYHEEAEEEFLQGGGRESDQERVDPRNGGAERIVTLHRKTC